MSSMAVNQVIRTIKLLDYTAFFTKNIQNTLQNSLDICVIEIN